MSPAPSATGLVDTQLTRVGALPRQRLFLTAGEWVVDGLRLMLEYSRAWDYSLTEGGTGRSVNGWVTTLTYVW